MRFLSPFVNRHVAQWVSVVGGAIAIISSLIGWIGITPKWVFAVAFIFLAIALIALAAYETAMRRSAEGNLKSCNAQQEAVEKERRQYRDKLASYSGIFDAMHSVVHDLRDFMVRAEVADWATEARDMAIYHVFVGVMDDVGRVYSTLTGRRCSACVKLFTDQQDPQGNKKLVTYCRDRYSSKERGRQDGREFFTVAGNTDFHYIINGDENWFVSNDLCEHDGYINQRANWERRYRSAVVLPIQRTNTNGEPADFLDILGFLCIDSTCTGVFDEDTCVRVGGCIADNLYWPLHQHQRLSDEEA